MVFEIFEFLCPSYDFGHNFARGCTPTQPPTQKLKSGFLRLSSQEISSRMIFEALQFEIFRFKFHSLGSRILKFPEFNLPMFHVLCRVCFLNFDLDFQPTLFQRHKIYTINIKKWPLQIIYSYLFLVDAFSWIVQLLRRFQISFWS